MRKLKILYSTNDTSKNVIRYGDFFKQEVMNHHDSLFTRRDKY
ncbi:hypothetical protein ABEI56_09035 [Peribacillus castrilensis]